MATGEVRLIYISDGRFIPGIPARDLTKEEVDDLGGVRKLKATGLYADPPKSSKKKSKSGSEEAEE